MKSVTIKGKRYTVMERRMGLDALFDADLSPYDEITIQGADYLYQFIENKKPKLVVLYNATKREVYDMEEWMDKHIVGVFRPIIKRK